MDNNLIEIKNINKKYFRQKALDNVSFNVKEGKICGLIGENGAGKTTLIRILTGLIKPDFGEIIVKKKCKISALIENPALYYGISALDNVKYQLLLCGVEVSNSIIENSLELVGLARADWLKKVKNYSLGMKQRLAIALAITDNPELLILDEPINGLDPQGIKDIRQVIFTLKNKLHMTILISSHVLAELDLVADEYVIMNKGKVLKEISKVDILHLLQDKILLECSIPESAKKILSQNGVTYTKVDSTLEINKSPMSVTQIIDLLRKEQIEITGIYRKKTSLEDYYFSLIERNL